MYGHRSTRRPTFLRCTESVICVPGVTCIRSWAFSGLIRPDTLLEGGVAAAGGAMSMRSCSAVTPALETVVRRVFDGFMHAQVGSRECDLYEHGGCYLLASVGMHGAVDGVMSIFAPLELCAELAVAQIGTCECVVDVDALAISILAEIAGVSAGCLATILEPIETTWLTPPAVTGASPQEWEVLRMARHTAVLDVEGRQVLVSADVAGR